MRINDLIAELQGQNPENKVEFRVNPMNPPPRVNRHGFIDDTIRDRPVFERIIERGSTTEIHLR